MGFKTHVKTGDFLTFWARIIRYFSPVLCSSDSYFLIKNVRIRRQNRRGWDILDSNEAKSAQHRLITVFAHKSHFPTGLLWGLSRS